MAVIAAIVQPGVVSAQTIRGTVVAARTSVPIAGVSVQLLSQETGRLVVEATTGPSGTFVVEVPEPGVYWLSARLVGYRPVNTRVEVPASTVTLQLVLEELPVQLDTLFVRGNLTPGELEFESRRHLKWNFSYDWTQFEAFHAGSVRDVIDFGLPGGMFRCRPQVYLDGTKLRTFTIDNLPLDWVYGVEIYRTYYDIPLKYRDPFGDKRCGGVLVWTHPVGQTPPQ